MLPVLPMGKRYSCWTKYLAKERHDARLLASARGPVKEQMAHLLHIFLVRHASQLRRQLLRGAWRDGEGRSITIKQKRNFATPSGAQQ